MCRTCAFPAWCTRASCGRRATARVCANSRPPPSRRCRACSRSCATAASSPSSPSASSRRCRRCARSAPPRAGTSARRFPTRAIFTPICSGCLPTRSSTSTGRRMASSRRAQPRSELPAAVPDAWRDRTVLRGRLFKDGTLTVWTHSQGVYPLRKSIAEMLRLPDGARAAASTSKARAATVTTRADDAAADAALIARAFPGRPVRVQWMREQEHRVGALRPGDADERQGGARRRGNIVAWDYEVTEQHAQHAAGRRRQSAAGVASGDAVRAAGAQADPAARRRRRPQRHPALRVAERTGRAPLRSGDAVRVSALRALGAYMNIFSIESFMDELALAAGVDPVEFRLRHLDDPRARDVIALAASRFGWSSYARAPGRGTRLSRSPATRISGPMSALALEVDVDRETGSVRVVRAVAAVDSGQAVNPDGIRNQIEGGIIQSSSWTLHEAVDVRQDRDHQRRLEPLSDAAFSRDPGKRRRSRHRSTRPALPRHGRSGAGSDRRRDRQRDRECVRRRESASCRSTASASRPRSAFNFESPFTIASNRQHASRVPLRTGRCGKLQARPEPCTLPDQNRRKR